MTETIFRCLLRLSEEGSDAILTGAQAQAHYGREFERLLHQGVLQEEARLADWPVCSACECDEPWRQLEAEDGKFRARCPLNHKQDVVLDAEALRVFRLDHEVFAQFLAKVSGLSGEAGAVVPGVWNLGVLPSRRQVAVCFERGILEQSHLPVLLGQVARPHFTLLAPRAKPQTVIALGTAGVDCAELALAWETGSDGSLALNTALIGSGGEARLTLDMLAHRVFVDGTPQHVPGQPFRMLDMLVTAAAEGRGPVPKFEIEERMSGRNVGDLARDLRNALSRERRNAAEIRSWIVFDRAASALRISLPAAEIELRR